MKQKRLLTSVLFRTISVFCLSSMIIFSIVVAFSFSRVRSEAITELDNDFKIMKTVIPEFYLQGSITSLRAYLDLYAKHRSISGNLKDTSGSLLWSMDKSSEQVISNDFEVGYSNGSKVGTIHLEKDLRAFYAQRTGFFVTMAGYLFVAILIFSTILFIVIRKSFSPLEDVRDDLLAEAKRLELDIKSSGDDELVEIKNWFFQVFNALEDEKKIASANAKAAAAAALASQVAHNIRSPLAVLRSIEGDLHLLPEKTRRELAEAILRIQSIANNLLESGDAHRKVETEPLSAQSLSSVISAAVAEKKLEFRERPGIGIQWHNKSDRVGPFVMVQPTDFKCVLSNLINNAVEASGAHGRIEVLVSEGAGWNQIFIRDQGKGIPKNILPRLMQRGETHGKDGGHGEGLFHAKTSVEAWGGRLSITSEEGLGTTVTIELPACTNTNEATRPPEDATKTPIVYDAILIDDDLMIHGSWKWAAERQKKLIRTFETVDAFLRACPEISPLSVIYVDSQLNDGVLGEHASKEIFERGFKKIYLATGRNKGDFDLSKFPWLQAVLPKNAPWEA